MNANDLRVVLCTCPKADAARIARTVLEERLVACVNVVGGVKSLYWWQDEITEDDESLLVLKTTATGYSRLQDRLQEVHPYEVPEILSLRAEDGSEPYIAWVFDATRH